MSKVLINETSLTAIGEAIREKNGSQDKYKPSEMAAAIGAIETGGCDIPEEAFNITGSATYYFGIGWEWFLNEYGNKITTKDLTSISHMFNALPNTTEIPFEINCKVGTNIDCQYTFHNCYNLKSIPKINNCKLYFTGSFFEGCRSLSYLPEDIESWFDWSHADSTSGGGRQSTFRYCYGLRWHKAICDFLNHGKPNSSNSQSIYYNGLASCICLDMILGLPIPHKEATWTTNAFSGTFSYCTRLSRMTFATDNGNPIEVKWKNQTLDLSGVGYVPNSFEDEVLQYSNITKEHLVNSNAAYQALKDNPNWYATSIYYCRYNHDSAVETINSLPDTSAYLATAGGTNTIKLKRYGGRDTDGGSVSNLTAEEIAVATAKGWTVSLSY